MAATIEFNGKKMTFDPYVTNEKSNSDKLRLTLNELNSWRVQNEEDIDKMLPDDVVIAVGNIVAKYFYGKDDLYSN